MYRELQEKRADDGDEHDLQVIGCLRRALTLGVDVRIALYQGEHLIDCSLID